MEYKEYGLIGFPLTHSFSQKYFNEKFRNEKIAAEYINFEIGDIGDLMEIVAEHPALCGFNVTRPYKELVIPYLDGKNAVVEKTGAANVVKIERGKDGSIRFMGYNTDYEAFRKSISDILGTCLKKALILGTGGASKAVEAALDSLGFESVKVSRKPGDGQISYDDLSDCIKEYPVIVNTTPLGTYPKTDESAPIPYNLVNDSHICYDLVYNPSITEFMKRCAERGATVKNGLEMLRLQAEFSWEIWEGRL